jgi:hypothetical protein
MSKKVSDWHIPSDWAFQFGLLISIPAIAILTAILLPIVRQLQVGNVVGLFWSGWSLGCVGAILLYFARRPLYRQRRYFTFGPKSLPPIHRKIYWLAYAFVVASVLLLSVVWLRIK